LEALLVLGGVETFKGDGDEKGSKNEGDNGHEADENCESFTG
jgi:hypothetical protein